MQTMMRSALLCCVLVAGCAFPRETKMEPIAPTATTPPPARDKAADNKPAPGANHS